MATPPDGTGSGQSPRTRAERELTQTRSSIRRRRRAPHSRLRRAGPPALQPGHGPPAAGAPPLDPGDSGMPNALGVASRARQSASGPQRTGRWRTAVSEVRNCVGWSRASEDGGGTRWLRVSGMAGPSLVVPLRGSSCRRWEASEIRVKLPEFIRVPRPCGVLESDTMTDTAVSLYLGLLKQCVTNLIYQDPAIRYIGEGPEDEPIGPFPLADGWRKRLAKPSTHDDRNMPVRSSSPAPRGRLSARPDGGRGAMVAGGAGRLLAAPPGCGFDDRSQADHLVVHVSWDDTVASSRWTGLPSPRNRVGIRRLRGIEACAFHGTGRWEPGGAGIG
jgi:hypothetical protein